MQRPAPIISEHKLQRFHRWMLLWLAGFVAFLEQARAFAPLSAQAAAIGHQWLHQIERLLVRIVIVRAAPHVRARQPSPRPSCAPPRGHAIRAIIGGRLRRKLRARDLHRRIAALRQSVDDLVAAVLKRMPRGLTRRRPILPAPTRSATPLPLAHTLMLRAVDSS